MYKKLDLETWPRRAHFEFFKAFEEPFFGVTFNVDVTKAMAHCKEKGISFFIYYLHKAISAANSIEAFRYRIKDNEVFVYDRLNASPTINRPNGTFGFSYIPYEESFEKFHETAKKEIDKVRAETTLIPSANNDNTIHFSAIPWVSFTSISHARSFSYKESIPKISFGKVFEENGKKLMPTSVHVHHALMDGYHVGLFSERFDQLLHDVM